MNKVFYKTNFTNWKHEMIFTDDHNPHDLMNLPHVNLEPVLGSLIIKWVPEGTKIAIKDRVCNSRDTN